MCAMLLLLLAALTTDSTAALPNSSTGQNFVVVFPENIAYYHPIQPQNKIRITAFYNNTVVNIKQYMYDSVNKSLNAGESGEYILDARLELTKSNISNTTLQVTSNRDISVYAVSYRNNSVQTALVLPTDKLGTSYVIPPIPNIPGTTDVNVTIYVTERAPFRLILVNGGQQNTVTVEGKASQVVQLQPNQAAQVWLQQQDELQSVSATQPVAALFGHSCSMRENCTCGLLYTMLPPTQAGSQRFLIPPVVILSADSTSLLLSDQKSIVPFNPDSPQIESASSVLLYRPGLLLPLIAESDFASCFVVNSLTDMQTYAVILVNKDYSGGVNFGSSPGVGLQWHTLKGTDYVWTQMEITLDSINIWHSSYTMAVYFGGTKQSALFGNPAAIVSRSPDYRGCVLTPEVLHIGEAPMGWPDSVQYCKNMTLELISISSTQFQTQVYQKVVQTKSSRVQDMWIGMRRSSQTGDWYWLNRDPVQATDWGVDEPGGVNDGQCAIMSQNSSTNFDWRDEDCCKAAYPICYSEPVLFLV